MKSRIMPTTHDSSVIKERVLLLACLMEGRSITVGMLIHREIAQCPAKRLGRLFFPNLISKLCMKCNAPVVQHEVGMREKRVIDKPLLDRLIAHNVSRRSTVPVGAIHEMTAHQTRISTGLAELKSMVAALVDN